jgi:predicted ArsR family transcriptional regulator
MKRPTLAERIPRALALMPMTTTSLARSLAANPHSVWLVLVELQDYGTVCRAGKERSGGRPHARWGIPA